MSDEPGYFDLKSFKDEDGQRHWVAADETAAERFFMNVVLCRVLYAHALVAAPRLSLSWVRPLAPLLGDPRLGIAGIFLQLSRVLRDEYPPCGDVDDYLSDELSFGRLLDFGMIVPRLQQLYEWSAYELSAPGLLDCARDGSLVYAWRYEDRGVWHPTSSLPVRSVRRLYLLSALRPRHLADVRCSSQMFVPVPAFWGRQRKLRVAITKWG